MEFEKTSEKEEEVAAKIVDAAYTVHKVLGPGLLEKIYETCFCHELKKRESYCFKGRWMFRLSMMELDLMKG